MQVKLQPATCACGRMVGVFTHYCGNTGWNSFRNQSAQNIKYGEEKSSVASVGDRTATFRPRVGRLTTVRYARLTGMHIA